MSFSTRVRYTAAGSGREFDIPFPYLDAAHVKVLVRGLPAAFAWVSPSRIALATTPASGEAIDIRRETPVAEQLVDFQDGSTLTAEELNTSAKQLLFSQQELLDSYQKSLEEAEVKLGEDLGVTVPPAAVVDTIVQLVLNDAALDNIAGLIVDINANATSILAQTLRVDDITGDMTAISGDVAEVRGLVDTILSGGAGLDEDALAAIYTETTARIDGDNALASVLALIGAKNVAGTAFILNLDTVKVSLTETLATRLSAISAEFGAVNAAVLAESTARATAISSLASTVSTVSAVANARNRTYAQTTAPASGMVAGDIWFDTDDGNKAYRYNGTAWVETDDARIVANAAAIVATNTAWANGDSALATSITNVNATALSRNRTFYAATAPSGAVVGDLWFDTANGNKPYRYNGTAWADVTDNRIAVNSAAISTESTARADGDSALASTISSVNATALARNRTFSQGTAPTGAVTGDLWYDTANGNRLSRYNGTAWVLTDDTRIAANAAAITAANTARADGDSALASSISSVSAVANARNRTYGQATAPTGAVTGDLWFDTDDSNKAYRYDGTSWVLTDDTRIGSNAAAITTEATARATADTALATTLSLIGAVGDSGTSFIIDLTKTKVGPSETFGSRLSSITTAASNNAAAIITEQSARISADDALSARIDVVSAALATAGARTYAQTTAPAGAVSGDIWFDTDDSNKAYRYNGSAWVAIDDARIAGTAAALTAEQTARATADTALTTSINSVSAVANARNRTYAQTTAPASGMVTGDLWFDTDDGNKSYRYNGTAWVATDDTRLATNAAAITAEQTARANADTALTNSITTLTSSVSTANARITTEENTRASETAALSSQVTSVSAVANGRNRTFAQPSAPSGANSGDLWMDTDDSNKLYRYNGSSWAAVADTRIATTAAGLTTEQTARADADAALSSQITTVSAVANARNRTYAQTTAPSSGMVTGDLWFDTDDNNKAYRYSGSAWVATDDTRIASNAAAITTEATTRATADTALTNSVNTLTTSVGTLTSRISTEETTRASETASLSSQITTVSATANGRNRTFAQTSAPSSPNSGDLWVDTDDSNKLYRYNGTAWVAVDDARIATNAASLTTTASAVADINGRLAATYGFQLDVNGRVSGMKAQAVGSGGAVVSTIDFTSDKFRVFNGTSSIPAFEVSGGNTYVAGNFVQSKSIVNEATSSTYPVRTTTNYLLTTSYYEYLTLRWYPKPGTSPRLTLFWGYKVRGGVNQGFVVSAQVDTTKTMRLIGDTVDTVYTVDMGDAAISQFTPPSGMETPNSWVNNTDYGPVGDIAVDGYGTRYVDFTLKIKYGNASNPPTLTGGYLVLLESTK